MLEKTFKQKYHTTGSTNLEFWYIPFPLEFTNEKHS